MQLDSLNLKVLYSKIIVLIIINNFKHISTFSQPIPFHKSQEYKITHGFYAEVFDIINQKSDSLSYFLAPNQKILLYEFTIKKDNIVIGYLASIRHKKNLLYLLIKTQYANNLFLHAKENYSSLAVGTLILPIKFRPRIANVPFDVNIDYNLGNSLGYRVKLAPHQPLFFNFVGSVGISSITLDKEKLKSPIVLANNKSSALTYAFSTFLEYNGVQFGFAMGRDLLAGSLSEEWIYQRQNWFSIGIGYQFMSQIKK